MAERIKLVQGDTKPSLIVTLTDETSGDAINISGATPRLKFRAVGATTLTDTLEGMVLDGAAGSCRFDWGTTTLAGPAGQYEGEIEITFSDGTVQTVSEVLKFQVRAEF